MRQFEQETYFAMKGVLVKVTQPSTNNKKILSIQATIKVACS